MHTKTYLNITKSANLKGVEAGERHCTNPAFARQSTHKIINSSACNFTVKPSNTKRAYGKLGKTWIKARQRNKGHHARKNKLVRLKATNHKTKFCCTSKGADLGIHKLDLLYAFSSVEGIRNCASNMDENFIIRHRVQHVRLITKRRNLTRTGLKWDAERSYLYSLSKGLVRISVLFEIIIVVTVILCYFVFSRVSNYLILSLNLFGDVDWNVPFAIEWL